MRRAWLPVLCAALQVLAVGTGGTRTPGLVAGAAFILLGLASGAALWWRHTRPFQVFVSCAVAYAVQAVVLAPPVPAAMAVMSYELVRRPHPESVDSAGRTRWTAGMLAAAVVGGGTAVAVGGQLDLVAPFGLVVLAAAAAGLLLASHDAREEARRRDLLADQRLRIARDLHDVVGHSVGAISVQAGAARMALAAGAPGSAATAVLDIEAASRDLLREVRWLVGLLREDAGLPGLAEVDGLLDSARRSGLDIRVLRTGGSGGVPPEVGHAAYRILQEAMTNVLRHGDARRAEVTVEVTDAVLVRVCNRSPEAGVPTSGHGLIGMRERAAEVGGTVHAGWDGNGSWIVDARLPLRVRR